MMWGLAALAATFAIGGWLGIRYERASHRINTDITTYLLSIPDSEWKQ